MSYRIKHIKSGLYYQPITNGNNLSKKGKIYHTLASANRSLGNLGTVTIQVDKKSSAYELSKEHIKYRVASWKTNAVYEEVPTTHFWVEEMNPEKKFTKDDILLAMGYSYGLTARAKSFEEHKAECVRYVETLNSIE